MGRTTARGPAVDAFRQDPKAHGHRYRVRARLTSYWKAAGEPAKARDLVAQ